MSAVPDTAQRAASPTEVLIHSIAGLLAGCRHVAVGASSPIPGAAALYTRAVSNGATRVSVLGSRRHNAFTNGGVELFDLAAQGRIDAFFLGGGQIDGQANINLVGIGAYPPGGPHAMITSLCLFDFDRARRRFVLKSVHPGHTLEQVRDNTGFDFDIPEQVPATPAPDAEALALIRGRVREEIGETYPKFAAQLAG